MPIALTRPVSPSLANCELTHREREPIDPVRAAAQHAAYEGLLETLGATLLRAPAAPDAPDAVFVEDTAVVLDELAVIARPGAASRRCETEAIARLLADHRALRAMSAPATLDGGDVLRLGRRLYVGRSGRTNAAGIEQLRAFTEPFGYRVVPVEFRGCLHLKSAVTALADDLVLLNPGCVAPWTFAGCETIAIDEREPEAANALALAGTIVFPDAFPRTRDRLLARGLAVATVALDELGKAEGAVTCCSLVFEATGAAG